MAKILVGIPCHDRRIDLELFKVLINVERQGKHDLNFMFPVSSHLSRNRNMCCHTALDEGHDWLLFLDSDIAVEDPQFIDMMIETSYRYDAQIVCGAYRMKDLDLEKLRYPIGLLLQNGEYENMESVTERRLVDAGGTGIMLIKREVLEKMEDPWFTIVDGKDLFVMPEDWEFCRKVRELGFKIAVDPRFETKHYGFYPWIHP